MIVPLIILLAITFVAARPSKKPLLSSYNSFSQTQAIKGFFVITIFFSHFCSYVQLEVWYDSILQKYCSILGQLMVAPFFFYSGYGIFESVKKKGLNYIKAFPQKRILKTLVHFDFAVVLYILLNLIIDRSMNISDVLLSLIGWESIGNSNWFIFAILVAYVFAFIGLSLFKNLKYALLFIVAMSFVYVVLMSFCKDAHWFDTILAFPLGAALSLYKDVFNRFACKKNVMLGCGGLCCCVLFFAKERVVPSYFVNAQLALLAFSFLVILFSLHFSLSSRLLNWFGTQVFGIYILQRLPMNLFAGVHMNECLYIFFVASFVCTIFLAVIFSKWNDFFDHFFLGEKK